MTRAVGAVLDRVHRDPGLAPELLVVTELEAALARHVAHLEGAGRLLDLLCRRLGDSAEDRRGPGPGRPEHLHGGHAQRTLDRVDAVDVVGQRRIGDAQRDGVDEGFLARRGDPPRERLAVDADDRGELRRRACRCLAGDLGLVDADVGHLPLGHELVPGPVDDVRPLRPLLREVERLVDREIRSDERGAPPDLPDVVDAAQAHLGVVAPVLVRLGDVPGRMERRGRASALLVVGDTLDRHRRTQLAHVLVRLGDELGCLLRSAPRECESGEVGLGEPGGE